MAIFQDRNLGHLYVFLYHNQVHRILLEKLYKMMVHTSGIRLLEVSLPDFCADACEATVSPPLQVTVIYRVVTKL